MTYILREHVQLVGKEIYGYVNLGDGPGETTATHAMVVMCNSLLSAWKIPVGYFLIGNKFTGAQRAELVLKVLEKIKETGAIITNIVCDNPKTNHTMVKCLGASIDPEDLKPFLLLKNVDGSNIYVILDPPHVLKLTRNTLGDYKVLIDGEGGRVEWRYIENLHELQKEARIHLANKIRKPHIEFRKNPMNVRKGSIIFHFYIHKAFFYSSTV